MIIATAAINLLTSVPLIKANVATLTQNYMNDMASLLGDEIENEIGYLGAEAVLNTEELTHIAEGIQIAGMDSSYAYIVSADGTMMYHPTPDKIGQPVENKKLPTVVLGSFRNLSDEHLDTSILAKKFEAALILL